MIWKFPKRLHVRVHVQRDGRLGMPEPPRQLDGADALLVPKGGAPVSESVWAEPTGVVHGGAETVATAPELEAILEDIRKHFGYRNEASPSLALASFSPDPYLGVAYVIWREIEYLADTQAAKLHDEYRQHEVVSEAGE